MTSQRNAAPHHAPLRPAPRRNATEKTMSLRLGPAGQARIEEALLNGGPSARTMARLMASDAWPAFERWLASENRTTEEKAGYVASATVKFAAFIVIGVIQEQWPDSEEALAIARTRLDEQLCRLWGLEGDEEEDDVNHS